MIYTEDHSMKQVLQVAANIASSRATVLIGGESGTGKELLARYIHAKSSRAGKRFVAVNCAAVPENLLESELFGHERGAFTGADSLKIGKFEQANNSSFLLDEVSEMPLLLQAKLLRVIQESEVERVGGKEPIKVNVRIIAATNRNLAEMVAEGKFREDLFYRINVIPLEIPALRSRPRDIEMLSRLFVDTSCANNGVEKRVISKEGMRKLLSWKWPGNIRELQNVIERSVLLSSKEELGEEELHISSYVGSASRKDSFTAGMTVSEVEKLLILKTLEHTRQNRTQAAQLLGISIRTLRNKIREYKGSEVAV